jgi:uncharacterized protein
MKVVLDTNIFISYLLFNGRVRRILNQFFQDVEICMSDELELEILRILRDKFDAPSSITKKFQLIVENSKMYNPKQKIFACRDYKDNFILELAEEAKARLIITGDKDLLVLQHWHATEIIKITYLEKFMKE